jgi:HD-GYP domain-containing protein (c-di-GMP phosphodiesterase class II)
VQDSQDLIQCSLDKLTVGERVRIHICDANGILLLARGQVVSQEIFYRLQLECPDGFYSTESWPEPYYRKRSEPRASDDSGNAPEPAAAHTMSVEALRSGMRIAHSICDDRGVLLLAAHSTITPRFLQLLRNRKLQRVIVRPAESAAITKPDEVQTPLTSRLDALSDHLVTQNATPTMERWTSRRHLPEAALVEQAHLKLADYNRSVEVLAEGMEAVSRGVPGMLKSAMGMLKTFIESMAMDMDLIPYLLALKSTSHEYLYNHCMNVSLLSMNMAAQIGYSQKQVHQLGVAALFSDVGMIAVPDSIRMAERPLSEEETHVIQQHPVHTLQMLGRNAGIDPVVLFVSFQVHERCDGSGYPRQRHKPAIHPYARIIGLADVYSAMTCPRPYRDPLPPYDTMEAILAQAKFGEFDAVALRGLLDCMSLYPIGSSVKLNTGDRGQVVRSAPGRYDRPVIALQSTRSDEFGEIIDLMENQDLNVVRVLS